MTLKQLKKLSFLLNNYYLSMIICSIPLLILSILLSCIKPNPDFKSYCELESDWPQAMINNINCQNGKCNCFDECGKQVECIDDRKLCINFYTGDEIKCPMECFCLNGLNISCEDAINTNQCNYPDSTK